MSFVISVIALVFCSTDLSAQSTSVWDYGSVDLWSSSSSWQSGGVPGSADDAVFNTNATAVASLLPPFPFSETQTGTLLVSAGDVTLQSSTLADLEVLKINNSGTSFEVLNSGTLLTLSGVQLDILSNSFRAAVVDDGATMTLDGTHPLGAGMSMVDGTLQLGENGTGTININSGATVETLNTGIGYFLGSSGTATIDGAGSRLDTVETLWVGGEGTGTLNITDGGVAAALNLAIGLSAGSSGSATVSGSNSLLDVGNAIEVGGDGGSGVLNILDGGQVSNDFGYVDGDSNANVTISGSQSKWTNSKRLTIRNGGEITIGDSGTLQIGRNSSFGGALGGVHVGDNLSTEGRLTLTSGSQLTNSGYAFIGRNGATNGTALVLNGSRWDNDGDMSVGRNGTGSLVIATGGVVTNDSGTIGSSLGGSGTVNVEGTGSAWLNAGDLTITNANGILNLQNEGLVSVGGTTILDNGGTINLDGGRLEFGTMSLQDYSGINANTGSMAGNLAHSGYTNVATLNNFQAGAVDVLEVNLANSGVLYGDANLGNSIVNTSSGQLEVVSGERMRFAGTAINAGEINNFGGLFRFDGGVTNQSGGLVSGRGQFIADGGWTNDGVIATSGGFADFHGDLVNSATGIIAVGGGSTTTFYDDVEMDAANMNINVAEDSTVVFFGSFNGGSDGLGTVHAFGDLRPGNSPGVVNFGGDLEMGSSTFSYFEIGGFNLGEYDRLEVAGDLLLNGSLEISMLGGFDPGIGNEFLIANVNGSLIGQFSNLSEGGLVGTFSGRNLFISYSAGDGNDVGLFSAVPEPGSATLLVIGMITCGLRRRRAS